MPMWHKFNCRPTHTQTECQTMALIIRTQPRLCRLIVTQTATLQTATLVSTFWWRKWTWCSRRRWLDWRRRDHYQRSRHRAAVCLSVHQSETSTSPILWTDIYVCCLSVQPSWQPRRHFFHHQYFILWFWKYSSVLVLEFYLECQHKEITTTLHMLNSLPRGVMCHGVRVEIILIMAALRSRCGHYIFALWFLSFFFFFPRLISAFADWMSTILRHMMAP